MNENTDKLPGVEDWTEIDAAKADPETPMSREWHWHPDLPISNSAVFSWPPNLVGIARWFRRTWLSASLTVVWFVLAVGVWHYLYPSTTRMAAFEWGWVAQLHIRNLITIIMVAGGLHLYFYSLRRQGKRRKFDGRGLAPKNRTFTFNNQIHDNMFWTLASGATVWTGLRRT